MSNEISLSAEERKDLEEAVAAEQQVNQADALFAEIMGIVQTLPPLVYKMLGREPSGPLAYCRGLAIQRLEEFLHRVGDGRAALIMRERATAEAIDKAASDGKIVNIGGRP